ALFDSIDKRTDLALYSRQLAASDDMLPIPSGVQAVQLAVVFRSKLANERRVHQAVLEAGKDARLEHIAPDGQHVLASSAIAGIRASIVMLTAFRETTTALAAPKQGPKQVCRPSSAFGANAKISC